MTLWSLSLYDQGLNVMIIPKILRLTPAYLAVIALYSTWLPKLGSGPLWDSRISLEQERCQSSWWLNLLYINNYFGTDKLVCSNRFIWKKKTIYESRIKLSVHVSIVVLSGWYTTFHSGTISALSNVEIS